METRSKLRMAKGALFGLCFSGMVQAATVSNPIMWSDMPDPSVILVGTNYYMSFTTMHMAPGLPIMKSADMVNWKMASYCYSTLVNNDEMNLNNGKTAYGKGSWAASLRYKDGTYYALVPSYTSGKTHLYSTADADNGPWKEVLFPFYHDPSLHMDADGRNFVVYGAGDIHIVQLNKGLTGTEPGGINKTLISSSEITSVLGGAGTIVLGEGSHIEKIGDYYYVFIISWPNGGGFDGRSVIAFRSKTIDGKYEGKVVLSNKGVAQGSVIQDIAGKWWGYMFQDNGSVGRSPWLMPVTWVNDWPVFNGGVSPTTFSIDTKPSEGTGFVTNDDFNTTCMKLEWQWNHNPDNTKWSLSARPGYYRITTSRTDAQVVNAKNTLTQRTFGPKCSGRVSLDVSGLKDGDVAGLVALQAKYGVVGVKRSGTTNTVVMLNGTTEVASAPLSGDKVFLRIDMDFTNRTDKATFFYSTDSTNWKALGNTLQMSYELSHFVGYRFGLFAYSTKSAGGTADFDWFKIGASYTNDIDLNIYTASSSVLGKTGTPGHLLTYRWDRGASALRLRYRLTESGNVGFHLYDSRGRQVARMVESFQGTGDHFVGLGTSGLRDGSYILVGQRNGVTWGSWPVTIAK